MHLSAQTGLLNHFFIAPINLHQKRRFLRNDTYLKIQTSDSIRWLIYLNSSPRTQVQHFWKTDIFRFRVITWKWFNPRPAGPLDFPPPAGGGGAFERPPPPWSRLLVAVEKNKGSIRKLAKNHFEIISVIFGLRSKLRSPGVKIPKFSKTVFRQ